MSGTSVSGEDRKLLLRFITEVPNWQKHVQDILNSTNSDNTPAGDVCDCVLPDICKVCEHFTFNTDSQDISEIDNDESDNDESDNDDDSLYDSSNVIPGSPIKLETSVSDDDNPTIYRRWPENQVRSTPIQTQAQLGINSHAQGKLGEQRVCSVLRDNLPGYFDVRACGSSKNSADIRIASGRSILLIDVKNYNNSKVSVNEQNKLIDDVYRDPSVDGGIMLCIGRRGCTNVTETFHMCKLSSTTDGTKPIMIVHTSIPELIAQSVMFMSTVTAELRFVRGQAFDPDNEEKCEVPNELRAMCVQALSKMKRITSINDHADAISHAACSIRSETNSLNNDLCGLFQGIGFSVGGNAKFDFNGKKFPARYKEILTSMCEIKPPRLIERGSRNVFDFNKRGFVRVTVSKVTHSFSLDTPVKDWIDLIQHSNAE